MRYDKTVQDFNDADWTNIDETLEDFNDDYKQLQNEVDGHALLKLKRVAIARVAATTEQDTSFVFPDKAIIVGAAIDVKTKEDTGTTKTVDVGLKGVDADGLIDGASVATAGVILPTLLNTGQTLGALLRQDEDGSGGLVPAKGYSCGGKTLTYSLAANDYAELVADILVWYFDLDES